MLMLSTGTSVTYHSTELVLFESIEMAQISENNSITIIINVRLMIVLIMLSVMFSNKIPIKVVFIAFVFAILWLPIIEKEHLQISYCETSYRNSDVPLLDQFHPSGFELTKIQPITPNPISIIAALILMPITLGFVVAKPY